MFAFMCVCVCLRSTPCSSPSRKMCKYAQSRQNHQEHALSADFRCQRCDWSY